MNDSGDLQRLLADLEKQRDAYQEAFRRVQEQLTQSAITTGGLQSTITSTPRSTPPPGVPRAKLPTVQPLGRIISEEENPKLRQTSTGLLTLESSSASHLTGEESDDEEDQSLYAQGLLAPEDYDDEQLRDHLNNYEWDDYGRKILEPIFADKFRLRQRPLIPHQDGPLDDRSQYTDYQVFDVSGDGAPLEVDAAGTSGVTNKPTALWHTIKEVNPDWRQRKAVGRITIIREPSAILFAAIHLCMHKYFDVDEIFKHLVDSDSTSANLHRAFDVDPRRQSSFVFSFEYFTITGEECKPMKWQRAPKQESREKSRRANRIPITRCSSIVALSLGGEPIRKIRNPLRRARTAHGYAYDPWAPWHVLELQCYPDWNSTVDVHDSTQHYVNGVEAFMVTLLSEYQDAERRFEEIYKRITRLITPPLDFMFNAELRDKLLFEDGEYTYSRRYFWAYQTLGIMNDSMKSMVHAYEDTFTDEVWEGRHRTLWPLLEPDSPRNQYYKKKMAAVRAKFEKQIQSFNKLIREHEVQRDEIRGLRDQLFSGTSVMESRKSVEQAEITVQQGHNIKLLTMVSIFFLPLTFVTSVFGMTNMPQDHHYWAFAIVTVTICLPFFVLVGSLNSNRGMRFWRARAQATFKRIHQLWARKKQKDEERSDHSDSERVAPEAVEPLHSAGLNERMAMRLRKFSMARVRTQEEKSAQSRVERADFANAPTKMNGGHTLQSYSMRRPSAAQQAFEPVRLASMVHSEPDPKS